MKNITVQISITIADEHYESDEMKEIVKRYDNGEAEYELQQDIRDMLGWHNAQLIIPPKVKLSYIINDLNRKRPSLEDESVPTIKTV